MLRKKERSWSDLFFLNSQQKIFIIYLRRNCSSINLEQMTLDVCCIFRSVQISMQDSGHHLFRLIPCLWPCVPNAMFSACACAPVQLTQLCPALCDPIGCSPPGSSVHGVLQARTLKWLPCPIPGYLLHLDVESRSPASPALQEDSLPTEPPRKPLEFILYS